VLNHQLLSKVSLHYRDWLLKFKGIVMKKELSESLKLCFVSQKLPKGGAAADYGYLWPLCRSLAKRGHKVTVITSDPAKSGSSQIAEGVHIYYIDSPIIGDPKLALKEAFLDTFEELHLDESFDLVHSADSSGFLISLHKKQLGFSLASDINGIQLDQIFGLLGLTEDTLSSTVSTSVVVGLKFLKSFFGNDRKLLAKSDGVFVSSKQQKDILELYYFVPARKVYIIPYGVNAKELGPGPVAENPFTILGIEPDTKVVLTITPLLNVEETKNLLTAFERVVIKKPRTALVIVGEGPGRYELEEHTLNLVLASKVWFTGERTPEEIDSYISCCDIYVNLQSKSSGLEPTVLEAMASRKTVVASEVGTSSNLIQNGVDGFLLRPTEINSLSRLLLEAVSGQIDVEAVGRRAREKILKIFDTSKMVDETILAYNDILLSSGRYRK
jgi:1,2-diacylglycerol 3-alpha-glucosyltransferase